MLPEPLFHSLSPVNPGIVILEYVQTIKKENKSHSSITLSTEHPCLVVFVLLDQQSQSESFDGFPHFPISKVFLTQFLLFLHTPYMLFQFEASQCFGPS